MKNNRLTKFWIFKNQPFGTEVRAKDWSDLFENRMTKNQKEFWSEIRFKDEVGDTVQITREFIHQGMSFNEIVEDWKEHQVDCLENDPSKWD